MALDATGLYTVGRPLPSLSAVIGATGFAPVIRKTDLNGAELWARRLGASSYYLRPFAIAAWAGGVYIAGSFDTAPPGLRGNEVCDVFVTRYDGNGNEQWTRRFGSPLHDGAFGVAANETGVYIVGEAGGPLAPGFDAGVFVRKYSHIGVELWTRQEPGYGAGGVAVDATGVYMVGFSNFQPVLLKYDTDGNQLWATALATGTSTFESSIAIDGTSAYLARGGFLIKYAVNGAELWTRRYADVGAAVAVDGTGIYVSGATIGAALPGQCSAGQGDAVVRKYDASGDLVWTRQFGTPASDYATAVRLDQIGVYVAGFHAFGPAGSSFLAKLEKSSPAVSDSRPHIQWECVLNAASYLGGAVAPGEIVTILGSGLGPAELATQELTGITALATTLAGARILFNGAPAPLVYVSEKQSSAIVPYGVAADSSVNVEVEYRGVRSNIVAMPVVEARPGIFTRDGSGRGQAAIRNQDGSLNSPENPAARGSVIVFYATGEGLLEPAWVDGQIIGASPPKPKLPISVLIWDERSLDDNAVQAEVLSARAVAGSIPGLLEVTAHVPEEAPVGGALTISIQLGAQFVATGVTVALR